MTAVITEELEVVAGELLPAITLTEALFVPNGLDKILAHIHAEVSKHTPDISTERGRKAIASLARKVSSSNARIDECGKDYVAGIKVKAGLIDAERKRSRDFLNNLRDDTRKPLTDWEDAEENRLKAHEAALLELAELANVPFGASLEEITKRINAMDPFVTRDWQEFAARFAVGYEANSLRLNRMWEETKKSEDAQIEFLRLREEEAKRLQVDRDEKIKAEAAAKAKADAEAVALAATKAAELEAERKANAAALEAKRQQDEANERTRKAEEAVAKATRDAELAIERERQSVAEEKRVEAEAAAKREANKKHVTQINDSITSALVAKGIPESWAEKMVALISKNEIPSVRISY